MGATSAKATFKTTQANLNNFQEVEKMSKSVIGLQQ